MEKRKYGNTDMHVSSLGFGAAEIGFSQAEVSTVEHLLGSALDAGLNIIDTAACYSISEELIGKSVSHRRQDYYLFTKCGHASGIDLPDWDPALIERSIDRSLERLKTDYLDLVHLHTCSRDVLKKGEVIEALQKVRDKGKVRYIGYSGDHQDALYAVQTGAFDSLETSISLADQEALSLTLPETQIRGMGVTVKRPIANVAWNYEQRPDNDYIVPYWERLQKLNYDILRNASLQESVAAALRFTLSQPGVHTAIVGTNKPERWQENAAYAGQGPLRETEIAAIRSRWQEISKGEWPGLE